MTKEDKLLSKKLLRPDEAAEVLALSTRRVRQMIHEKQLRAVKIGKLWRIKSESVRELLEAHDEQ